MRVICLVALLGAAAAQSFTAADTHSKPDLINNFCTEIEKELHTDQCKLKGSSGSLVSGFCATNGVASGKDLESRLATAVDNGETNIKTSQNSLAGENENISDAKAEIRQAQILLEQSTIRFDAEEANQRKWENKMAAETAAFDRSQAEYKEHIDALDAFIVEMSTLLVDDAASNGSLKNIFSTTMTGSHNAGAYDSIKAEVQRLYDENKQERDHMTSEKSDEDAAWTTRKAALRALICAAKDNKDNSDGTDPLCASSAGYSTADTSAKKDIDDSTADLATEKANLQTAYKAAMDHTESVRIYKVSLINKKDALADEKRLLQERITAYHEVHAMCSHVAAFRRANRRLGGNAEQTTGNANMFVKCEKTDGSGACAAGKDGTCGTGCRIKCVQDESDTVNTCDVTSCSASAVGSGCRAASAGSTGFDEAVGLFVQLGATSRDPIAKVAKELAANAEHFGSRRLALFATSLSMQSKGSLDKVIELVKDMITTLQDNISAEETSSWCENQSSEVSNAVDNANAYVNNLQTTLDTVNSDISRSNTRNSQLVDCIKTATTSIQGNNGDTKEWEEEFLAEQQDLREGIRAFGEMKQHMANVLTSNSMKALYAKVQAFRDMYEADLRRSQADYQKRLDDAGSEMKRFKIDLARCNAELDHVKETLDRLTSSLDENNAAMAEALQSQTAANEMKTTFAANCDESSTAQQASANGATEAEKCAQTCHTVNALELACAELSNDVDNECYMCAAGIKVWKRNVDGAISFVCDSGSGNDFAGDVCNGGALAKDTNCFFQPDASTPVYHSDISCRHVNNGVTGCEGVNACESDGSVSPCCEDGQCRTEVPSA